MIHCSYNTEDASQILHTVPLGSNYIRVGIHEHLDDNAPLPIPHSELTTVSDAFIAFIVWPRNLSLLIHGYIFKIKAQYCLYILINDNFIMIGKG